jgi:hypothetical protein
VRYRQHLALLGAIALTVSGPRLSAQTQGQLFLSFTAPNGTPVTDLQIGDIRVVEDGVDCKLTTLEPVSWPTRLQVLVDNGTANTNPINSLRVGLRTLFELMPDGVEMSLYTTAGSPRPIVRPTTEKQKLIDGIALIAPGSGVGRFVDALLEATDRIGRDNTPSFPVILMIASDMGTETPMDRAVRKMQDTIITHAVTVHVSMMSTGSTIPNSRGQVQGELGLAVTKMTGGQYETINAPTRLATLLPELGKRIAESHARQQHQYRVTYERPPNPQAQPQISAGVRRDGTVGLSPNGHLP